jgi:hypothetical protein
MTTENNDQSNDQNNNSNENNDQSNLSEEQKLAKLVQDQVDSSLKPIKDKLDKAYSQRDDALRKIADFEREKREAELKKLEDEGKHKEVYELRLAEEKAAREALEKRNTELTRDLEVRNVLNTQQFRNENALEMAYNQIVGQLVRNDQNVWIHKSGVTIKDFIKGFSENDDNSFLFKQKVSSGAGSTQSRSSGSSDTPKSLFSMSQDEVLKMAKEGKLRR